MKTLMQIICVCFIISCNGIDTHDEKKMSQANLSKIKKKFSIEEINYFYEVAFYSDGENKILKNLKKWHSDLNLFLIGSYVKEDSIAVINSIKKINNLDLPVKAKLVKDEKKSNVKIYFGDAKYLSMVFGGISKFNGIARTSQRHGVINKGEIGITDIKYDSFKKKESLILEELTQVLGLLGDSYSYPESVFYEAHNSPIQFSEIDKKILNLLYNPNLPSFYSINEFEIDFSEILYSSNTNEKLKKIIKRNKVSKKTLNSIKESCFNTGVFFKHPRVIPIYINGDFNSKDIEFLNQTINSFNNFSSNLTIFLSSENEYNPISGIHIKYTVEDNLQHLAMSKVTNTNGFTMFPKIVKSEIDIKYTKGVDNQNEKNRNLIQSLYRSLAPINMRDFEKDWFIIENGTLSISKEYENIISLIYNNNFMDGYKLSCFNKLIAF